ncbi:MAG TPA: HIT family protein [Alphaproteobacteria bacterium]|nr:HIT family protein [Alphaproteobacteria bacterium]
MFKLDDRLANDTLELGKIGICKVLLSKDSNYPWIILVPELENTTEIHQLSTKQQIEVMQTITTIASKMETEFKADKINIGALGNVVKQLHIHIVARHETDIAWPGPIWGQHPAKAYTQEELTALAEKLTKLLEL